MNRLLIEVIILIALVLGGILYHEHVIHKAVAEGIAQQRKEDDDAAASLKRDTDAITAQLKQKAQDAENANHDELVALRDFRASHPIGQLCLSPSPNNSGAVVPRSATVNSQHDAGTPSATVVQSVHPGDIGQPSQSELLDALGALADLTAGQVREWQNRNPGASTAPIP